MDEKELVKLLEQEGFGHAYVWRDEPDAFYPTHSHETETAQIIFRGEMTLTMDGRSETYRARRRCDVPAGAPYSTKIGPSGWRYSIGERRVVTPSKSFSDSL